MSDFTGDQVNQVLRLVADMAPGIDAEAGNRQISILAVALCAAARDCGVERENFLAHLAITFDDVSQREMAPLFGST